jgi:hypothetical protein
MDFKERVKIFIGSHKLAIAVGLLALVLLYKKFFAAKTCSGSANTAPVCTCTAQCLNQQQPCYSSPSTIQYTLWNPPTLATTQQEVVILEASNHERSSVQVEPVEQPLIEKTASQIV